MSCTSPSQPLCTDPIHSARPDGDGLFYAAALYGWLSIARNEHHRDEVKPLKGPSGQHMQPSQDARPQSCLPSGSPPTSVPLQTPALAVEGPYPARRGRLLLLGLPGPLTGTPSINRDRKLSQKGRVGGGRYHRKIQNKKQHLISQCCSPVALRVQGQKKCIQFDLTNRLAVSLSDLFWS